MQSAVRVRVCNPWQIDRGGLPRTGTMFVYRKWSLEPQALSRRPGTLDPRHARQFLARPPTLPHQEPSLERSAASSPIVHRHHAHVRSPEHHPDRCPRGRTEREKNRWFASHKAVGACRARALVLHGPLQVTLSVSDDRLTGRKSVDEVVGLLPEDVQEEWRLDTDQSPRQECRRLIEHRSSMPHRPDGRQNTHVGWTAL